MRSLTLAALIAVPSFAQTIYTWEDAEGVHYTDDLAQVPKQEKKVAVESIAATPRSLVPAAPKPAPVLVAMSPAAAPAPISSEREWRDRFISANRRITTIRQETAALEATLPPRIECLSQPQPQRQLGTAQPAGQVEARCQINPLHDRLRVKIAQQGVELKNAEMDLEQLERQASMDAVPREWRRGW